MVNDVWRQPKRFNGDKCCYDIVLYDTGLYIVISYLLVCLFILRGINYFYSCSIYAVTLYVECGPILLHACLRTWLACTWQSCDQQNDHESSACARGLNRTGSRGILDAYFLEAIGRTLSELVLLSCVVFMLRHFVELFRKSTAERDVVVQHVGHLSERVVST